MSFQLLIILCSSILAQAGIIDKEYAPATSYSRFISFPVITKSIKAPIREESQIIYEGHETSPIFGSGFNTQESKYEIDSGVQQRPLSKSLISGSQINTIYSSESNNQAVSPLLYTTSAALPKPISLPSYYIGDSRILYNSKVTPGLSTYSSSSGPTEVKTRVTSVDQADNVFFS